MSRIDPSSIISAASAMREMLNQYTLALNTPPCDRTVRWHRDILPLTGDVGQALPAGDEDPEVAPWCRVIRAVIERIWEYNVLGETMNWAIERGVVAGIDKAISALESRQARRQRDLPTADVPPVICSQGAIARLMGKSKNTAGLIKKLERVGIITRSEKRVSKSAVWFADSAMHARALDEISEGPKAAGT